MAMLRHTSVAARKSKRTAAPPKRLKTAKQRRSKAASKYAKYEDKPRDVQTRIALFGPEYEADGLATLIYEIARGTKVGGTPLVFPPPKDVWYSVLTDAVFTGNVDNLQRAARIAKRAILALSQPFDPLALRLLEATNPSHAFTPNVDEFLAKHYPKLSPKQDESIRRRIRMVTNKLGVNLA